MTLSDRSIADLLLAFAKNAALTLLALFLALLLVEGALRLYNPFGFRLKGDKIVLPVNRTQIIHNKKDGKLDGLVVNKKNSLGFRGPEPPPDFSSWLTIVTVGGSTTECLALNEDKTWPWRLGNRLKEHFSRIWLDNAGYGGHSTFAHAILLQDFLVKLKPKVVLYLIGVNDVGRRDLTAQENLRSIRFKNLERLLIRAANHSEVASVLLNLYRFYFPVSIPLQDIREMDFRTLKYKDIPPAEEAKTMATYRREYLGYYRQRVERLVSLAREHGIDPVLITQPVLYGIGTDPATGLDLSRVDVYGFANGEEGWKLLELYNDVVREIGREQHVLVIDLAREMPKSTQYYYDLVHYDNEGSDKVADIIYSHLRPYLEAKFPEYCRSAGSVQQVP